MEKHYPRYPSNPLQWGAKVATLQLKVIPSAWQSTTTDEVLYLVTNTAHSFVACLNRPFSAQIQIECRKDDPTARVRCLNEAKNEHLVSLTTCDASTWCFQFAHELCHVLSGYHKFRTDENLWFHESLCELASIFTIRQMAESWRKVHLSNWAWLSAALQYYAQALMTREGFHLPNEITFKQWFRAEETSLRIDRYQRSKNGIVANRLLPLFEAYPAGWEAIRFLPDCGDQFETFLKEWQKKCPIPERRFVEQVAEVF
jgi:hypothetical protein